MEIEEIKEWCKSENLETNSNGVFKYHSDNGKEMINLPLIIKAFLIDKNFNQQQKEKEGLEKEFSENRRSNERLAVKVIDLEEENTKLKERVSELKTFEVDFDGSLKMLVEVRNNELTFKAAVNGFGQLVELDKIKITKND
jgi:hypothetical protein